MEKKRRNKMRAATGSYVKSMFVGPLRRCFYDISIVLIMIAAGFIHDALVTTNEVIETFESHV